MFMFSLWEEEGQTHAQIAQVLGVQPATVSNMVDRLENNGLVERRPDEQDQRLLRIHLTEQGRAIHQTLRKVWSEMEQIAIEGFSQEERLLLRRLLLQLYANLEKYR